MEAAKQENLGQAAFTKRGLALYGVVPLHDSAKTLYKT